MGFVAVGLSAIAITFIVGFFCWIADKIEDWAKSPRGHRFFNTKE